MNRRLADGIAGLSLAAVLAVGLYGAWAAYRRNQAVDRMTGSRMMDAMMGGGIGVDPLWYVLVTIVAAAVVGGVYAVVRDDLTDVPRSDGASGIGPPEPRVSAPASVAPDPGGSGSAPDDTSSTSDDDTSTPSGRRLLNLLPEDERRVLEPVIVSPGLTQIDLRDRAEFSKSKVSQTVSALEKRGLLYRERQGRTFRVYPDESIEAA